MKVFTIIINNNSYTSNDDGFLNLNDIWNRESLPDSKRPSQFNRYQTGKALLQSGNSQSIQINHLGAGTSTYIGGDELATVAYAM